ncbi:Ku protein [soil metagenome]|nr:Ku protein [Acidimicrobiia bacterium]
MARAIWNGSISFGLVNIPIKLYNAVSRKGVSFNQIDARSGQRIKMQRVGPDGEEVPYEQIVKGYQLSSDRFVLIDPGELDALDPETSSTIDIEEFVDLFDIDPIFFDSAYYLAPGKAAEKPYALLARAMEKNAKVALARFVMRTKQYLAAVRAKDGMLLLSTMVYADEVVPPEELPELDGVDDIKVSDKELAMASQLIESLAAEFEPERYRDTYRDKVMELIERKAAGEEVVIEAVAPADATKVVDLMAALEASVADARKARKRHPTAGEGAADEASEAEDDEDEDSAPAAAKSKRAAPAKRARKSA